jgi:triacylglycerol lipase
MRSSDTKGLSRGSQENASQRNPIVLVPGYRDTATVFSTLTRYLSEAGFQVYPVSLKPSDGTVALDVLAEQLSDHVTGSVGVQGKFDLIGFSMGGVVSRYYLQRLGGIHRVQRFVTLGSPHRGTWVAFGSNRPGVRQMRPGSDFLEDLAQDEEVLDQLNFTSLWTPFDLSIIPAKNSVLPVGRDERLLLPHHRSLVTNPQSMRRIVQALRSPVKDRPAVQLAPRGQGQLLPA